VVTRGVLANNPSSGDHSNLLLFITAPEVASLEVHDGKSQLVQVDRLAGLVGGSMYVGIFPDGHAGFSYTARDAAGNVVASAIT
jgi:hypothetical protein